MWDASEKKRERINARTIAPSGTVVRHCGRLKADTNIRGFSFE